MPKLDRFDRFFLRQASRASRAAVAKYGPKFVTSAGFAGQIAEERTAEETRNRPGDALQYPGYDGCLRGGWLPGVSCTMQDFVHGPLSLFIWAAEHSCRINGELTCMDITRAGNLEALKWAREHGPRPGMGARETGPLPWDITTIRHAVLKGHLEVVKWAHDNGAPWDESCTAAAAGEGQLEVLKWLREQGCPWDARTLEWAAMYGQLEALKWVRENSATWDETVKNVVRKTVHESYCGPRKQEILQWLDMDSAGRGGAATELMKRKRTWKLREHARIEGEREGRQEARHESNHRKDGHDKVAAHLHVTHNS
jgi:hypothetical protein